MALVAGSRQQARGIVFRHPASKGSTCGRRQPGEPPNGGRRKCGEAKPADAGAGD
jgi:hypothetical protein